MSRMLDFLFEPTKPLWLYCVKAVPLALLPSIALLFVVNRLSTAAGFDVSRYQPPDQQLNILHVLAAIIFAPIVETLLLGVTLIFASALTDNKQKQAALSALMWGALHGLFGLMWFFGTAWAFFVFSSAYLAWKEHGFRSAFLAAAVPHGLINATVFTALLVEHLV